MAQYRYKPEDGEASLTFFERLRPNMPIWPDREFLWFALRSICKAIYFSAILGGVWALLGIWSTSNDSNLARIIFLVSFIIDGFFIFTISLVSFYSGLLQNNWDNIIQGLAEGHRYIAKKFLWCIILNMSLGVITRYVIESKGGELDWFNYIAFNFFLSTLMGMTTAYRIFMMYSVYGKRGYAKYVKSETEGIGKFQRFMFTFRDKTKMSGGIVFAFLIPPVALTAAYHIGNQFDASYTVQIAYGICAALIISLYGVWLRIFDMIKLYGEQEAMFPYHELDLMKGPYRPLSKEEKEEFKKAQEEEEAELAKEEGKKIKKKK